MKLTKIALAAAALGVSISANAQEDYVMSCSDVITKLNREATPKARARYADMQGSCLGVVDRDGDLYMHTKMIVRRVRGGEVTLYLPATDRTFKINPGPTARVKIQGRKYRPRELTRGQELDLYVSVDKFTQPIIDEIAMPTETEELVAVGAVRVETLPTTG